MTVHKFWLDIFLIMKNSLKWSATGINIVDFNLNMSKFIFSHGLDGTSWRGTKLRFYFC